MSSTDSSGVAAPAADFKEIGFRHSRDFLSLLKQLQTTLLVSTHPAGKLVVVSVREGRLNLSFHNFDRPMGVATSWRWIAVRTRDQIWVLRSARDIAQRLQRAGHFDDCFLARRSHLAGEIQCYELAFGDDVSIKSGPKNL
jgi:uncharacterized protein (TIGR03032 family)